MDIKNTFSFSLIIQREPRYARRCLEIQEEKIRPLPQVAIRVLFI